MLAAKLRQWGFVVFRTAYREVPEEKWKVFRTTYRMTAGAVLWYGWDGASSLSVTHNSVFVCDPLLEGMDIDNLRQRFKTMRERGEIPDGIATDCFFVADEAIVNEAVTKRSLKIQYKPKALGDPSQYPPPRQKF